MTPLERDCFICSTPTRELGPAPMHRWCAERAQDPVRYNRQPPTVARRPGGERSVSSLLEALAIMFGAAALFGLALDLLPAPWGIGVAFAVAFAGGRMAQQVHPI